MSDLMKSMSKALCHYSDLIAKKDRKIKKLKQRFKDDNSVMMTLQVELTNARKLLELYTAKFGTLDSDDDETTSNVTCDEKDATKKNESQSL